MDQEHTTLSSELRNKFPTLRGLGVLTQAIGDLMHDAIFIADTSGKIIYANKYATKLTGQAANFLNTQGINDVMRIVTPANAAFSDSTPFTDFATPDKKQEMQIIFPNEDTAWIWCRRAKIETSPTQPNVEAFILRDQTTKRHNRILAKKLVLLENNTTHYSSLDCQTKILGAVRETLGADEVFLYNHPDDGIPESERLIGSTHLAEAMCDEGSGLNAFFEALLAAAEECNGSYRVPDISKHNLTQQTTGVFEHLVSLTCTIITPQHGRKSLLCLGRNFKQVTKRDELTLKHIGVKCSETLWKCEQRSILLQSQEQLRLRNRAIEESPICIVITEPDGTIVYANKQTTVLTGYSFEELVGQNPRVLNAGIPGITNFKEMYATIRAGKVWHGEFLNKKKNGDVFWEKGSISPIFNEQKEIDFFVALKEDITKEKAQIDQIDLLTHELMHTAEEAAEANKAKGEFLANISHEIRTPLNGIVGMSQILVDADTKEDRKECIDSIMACSKNLTEIVDEILEMSSLTKTSPTLAHTAFHPARLLKELQANFANRFEAKGITFLNEIDTEIPPVLMGDPFHLRKVLSHLVSNALKFTAEGTVVISTRILNKNETDLKLQINVIDSGIGIQKKNQKKIFRSFQQEDSSSTRLHGGVGLGLSISKSIVDLMGGSLSLTSEPGKGSTFTVEIPLALPKTDTKTTERIPIEGTPVPIPLEAQGAVLIIDGDALSMMATGKALSSMGLKTQSALNEQTALSIFSKRKIDLVLLDPTNVPINLAKIVRSLKQLEISEGSKNKIPIIAHASKSLNFDQDVLMAIGFDDYLPKPTSIETLNGLLAKWQLLPNSESGAA